MTRRIIAALLAAVLLLSAAGAAPVAAQSDGPFGAFFTDDEEDPSLGERIERTNSQIEAVLSQVNTFLDQRTSSPEEEQAAVETYANDTAAVFNNNSDTLENYTNARFSGNASDWNVLALTFEYGEGNTTRYLVADVDADGNFTNASMVTSTDRTVDKTVVLEDAAAKDASSQLEFFVENYAAEGRDIDGQLTSRLAPYAGDVDVPEEIKP